MATRSGSSKRKPHVTRKATTEPSDDEDSKRKKNGGNSSVNEDEDLEDLPEGTVVVQPEPVKENGKFSGPEFPSNKKKPVFDSGGHSLGRVTCTVCGDQINTCKPGAARQHPRLRVLLCKSCWRYYKSGPISKDEDGLDEQCRWCSEGGKLFGCDFCHNTFCKACIMRNLGRSELSKLQQEDQRWKCYVCDPMPLSSLVETSEKVIQYMNDQQNALKEKRKTDESSKNKSISEGKNDASSKKKSEKKDEDVPQSTSKQLVSTKDKTPVQQKPAIKGDRNSRIEVVYPREKKPVTVYNSNAPGMSNSSNFQRVMGGVQVNKPFFSFDNMQIGNVHSILHKLISITSSLGFLLDSVKQNLQLSGASDMVNIPSNRLSANQLMERNTAMGCIKSGVNLFLEELQIATCKNQMTNQQIFNQRFEAPAYTSTPIQTSKLGNIVKPAEVKEKEQKVMESANVGLNLEVDDDSVIIISCPSPGKGSKIDEDDPPLAVEARKSEAKVKLFCENKDQNNQETNGDQASKKVDSESKVTKERDTNGQKSEKPSGESSTETEVQEMDVDSQTEEEGEKSKGKSNGKKSSPSKEKSSPSKKNDNENIAAQLELLEEMAEEILGNDSVTEKDDEKNKSVKGISPEKKKSGKETGDGKSNDEDETEKEDEDKSENKEKKSENVIEVKNDDDKEGEEKENSKKDSGSDDDDSDSDTDTSDESDDKPDDEDFNEMWSSNKKKKWLKKKNKKDREKSKQSSEKKKAGKSEKGGRLKLKLKLPGDKKSKSEEAASKKKGDDTAKSDGTSSRRSRSLRSDGKSEETKNKKQKEKEEGAEESDFNSELEDEIDKLAKEPKSTKRTKQNDDKESKKEGKEKSTKKGKEEKSSKEKTKKGDKKNEEADNSSDDDDDKEEDNVEDDEKTDEEDTPMDVPVDDYNEAKEEDVEDEEEDNADDDSSDSEVIISPRKTRNRSRQVKDEEGSTEEDDDKPKKKRTRSSLLDTKLSDSDSDFQTIKKKGKKRKASSSSKSSSDSEQEFIPLGKKKAAGKGKKSKKKPAGTGKKRRRIKAASSSTDEEKISSADDDDDDEKVQQSDDNEDEDGSPNKHKRKKIRKIKSEKKLQDQTKAAAKAEEERRKRIAEKQKEFNGIVQEIDESSPTKCPVTKQLVLEQNSETKEPVLQVDKGLIVKLKPHQVEAVQFIWNCTMESLERSKKEKGSGCILAHCMGLGKTLTVISFVHTMLANKKKTKLKTCLVVCPLNTILNWENEFAMWQEYTDKEIDVYELASVKANQDRAETLKNWQSDGGAMIIGYDMYRNLSQGNHCKSKKLKAIFHETLVDPGPDLVVCDEGHILKNDQSAISKAMNKIVSRRRIVLTGTPLQNNLSEYHCMVNFVKCNLLGTMKEFRNRFVNPITNGQCSDSTSYDVKVMKRRAHILHEKLNGCVQRKDYSALTKFLSPKFEYVLSVRLAKVQMDLYEKYLELSGFGTDAAPSRNRGARLFSDYQALMRIWTHPWVLKMDEIRQEVKRMLNDDEDSFIDDDDYDEEKSSASDNSSNESSNDEVSAKSDDSAGPSSGRRAPGKAPEGDNNEVVKKWKSRTRGGGGEFPLSDEEYEPLPLTYEWWADYVAPEDKFKIELSGKLVLLFEILKRCEEIGDKVLVFSQSLLSLDLIEAFLENVDKQHQEETAEKDKKEEAMPEEAGFGKHWTRGEDYFRMDGSTNAQNRKDLAESFNDPENFRARLFLISTRAGGLGINLVAANRVIIFDASWNPSHDVQSIFRVYRFGQEKPVYVYRFLAQGTMEEKIYERQVTKQSLSQRVVDEHQIERHFSAADMSELYLFKPDRLDDPNRKEKTPILPKDTLLAELMTSQKDWIVSYHEHDSLLENKIEEELSEEERKAAWEEFENERTGINQMRQNVMGMGFQNMVNSMMMQSGSAPVMNMGDLQTMAQMGITQQSLLLLVQEMKQRYPHLPQEQLTMQVQNVIRQMITRQIMAKQEMQKREMEAKEMQYQQRLRQIHTQIEQQQQRLLQSQMYGQPRPSLGINPAYAHLLRNPNSGPQNRPSSSANRASPNPSSSELMKQLQGSKPS